MCGPSRVLVIEDDPDTATLFVSVLGEEGIVADGAAAADLPARDGYSAVLTDLAFGHAGYSSEAAVEWVETLRARYGAPVIVVTGQPDARRDDELAAHASDVIEKPLDIEDLVYRVRRVLR